MQHFAGGYVISHIASLFFKKKYWLASFFVAIGKEGLDHFVFGCGNNEIKHIIDILGWTVGGLTYAAIVFFKRRKYKWE